MTDLKAKLDADLNYLNINSSEEDIIEKANRKPSQKHLKPLLAAVVVLVLMAGICFAPNLFNNNTKNSFTVYAGAEELTDKRFVVISDDTDNFIHFDFNKILDENADPTDITKKYLFHSFEKRFKLRIEGDGISHVNYHINKGVLYCYEVTPYDNWGETWYEDNAYGVHYDSTYSENPNSWIFLSYDRQEAHTFGINPAGPTNNILRRFSYELPALTEYVALSGSGEIVTDENFEQYFPNKIHTDAKDLGYNPIAYGYKSEDDNLATNEEIEKLIEYAKADDMVGFYNYQNQVFKRIFDDIRIDVVVYNDENAKEYETVSIQLCYNPIEITEKDLKYVSENHSETLSKGTLSAKLIEMPKEREETLLRLRNLE